jgi:hypothetical protein
MCQTVIKITQSLTCVSPANISIHMCTAGVIVDSEPTPKSRRAAVDTYLSSSLGVQGLQVPPATAAARAAAAAGGGGDGVRVLHRRQLGSAVHIFSHIRQTMHAEELVILAPKVETVCGPAAAAAGGDGSGQTDDAAGAADTAAASKGAGATGKKRKAGTTAAAAAAAGTAAAGGGVTSGSSDGSSRPQLRWVSAAEISKQGLTSGVRKVLQLSLK